MLTTTDQYQELREAVRDLCSRFPDEYHRKVDEERAYPEAFVDELTEAGWLAADIPDEYGGSGLGLTEASVIMEEINRSGGNSGACHGQMYNMGTLLRHGSEAQKRHTCPRSRPASCGCSRWRSPSPRPAPTPPRSRPRRCGRGPLRRQRPEGLDLPCPALRPDDPPGAHHATFRGQAEVGGHVDLHGRPAPRDRQWHEGAAIPNMVNHETNELFFDNLEIPAENLIGEESKGFKYILDGLNAERTLIAAECIGDGYWFIDKVTKYANERMVLAGRSARTRACSSRSPRRSSSSRRRT